jgi:hypothetical protein
MILSMLVLKMSAYWLQRASETVAAKMHNGSAVMRFSM